MKISDISVKAGFGFFAVSALMIYFGGEAASFFAAVMVHELGHLATMLLLSKVSVEIRLSASGVYINPKYRRSVSKTAETVILIAGPIVGMLTGIALKAIFPTFFKASFILSTANIIPIRGTDGGSLLELYCGSRYKSVAAVSTAILFAIALILAFLPLADNEKAQPIWLAAAALLYFRGKFEK